MTATLSQLVTPSLFARDLGQTIAFYEKLGFRVTGRTPESAPTWVRVVRDGVTLHFSSVPLAGMAAQAQLSGVLYFHPDDVRALAAEWQGVVPFAWGPGDTSQGWHEFAITDPNGYTLGFAEPIET
jgi:catechol 2,3-dioxygenase-like lactoylglutathione lyase family enzyme